MVWLSQSMKALTAVVDSAPSTERAYRPRTSSAWAGPSATREAALRALRSWPMTPAARQAVADDVADGDGDAVAGQVDQVVPVAAHVQGADGGPVAHRRPVVADRAAGGQHRLLQGEGDLAFAGVGLAQAFVDLLQFPGAGVELGLQYSGSRSPRPAAAAGADELGDLLHPVHDQHHLSVRVEDGGVDRAPVPLLPLAGPVGRLDVVALQRHGVALAGGHHPQQ